MGFSPNLPSGTRGWMSEGPEVVCFDCIARVATVPRDTPVSHPLSQAIPSDVQWDVAPQRGGTDAVGVTPHQGFPRLCWPSMPLHPRCKVQSKPRCHASQPVPFPCSPWAAASSSRAVLRALVPVLISSPTSEFSEQGRADDIWRDICPSRAHRRSFPALKRGKRGHKKETRRG